MESVNLGNGISEITSCHCKSIIVLNVIVKALTVNVDPVTKVYIIMLFFLFKCTAMS